MILSKCISRVKIRAYTHLGSSGKSSGDVRATRSQKIQISRASRAYGMIIIIYVCHAAAGSTTFHKLMPRAVRRTCPPSFVSFVKKIVYIFKK